MTDPQIKKIQSTRRRVNAARRTGAGHGTACAIVFHQVASPVVAYALGVRDANRDVCHALYAPETEAELALRLAEDAVTEERIAAGVAAQNRKPSSNGRAPRQVAKAVA